MNKSIQKKHGRYLVVGALLLVAAGAVIASRRSSLPRQPTGLNAMLQQVRSEPGLWTASERDVSVLLLDMQNHDVTSLALAPAGMFVSTRVGTRYFVADGGGKLAGLVLASYQTQTTTFPLAVVGEDVRDGIGSHLDLGLVMTIALVSVLGIQGARVYRGNGFRFSKNESVVTFDDVIGAAEAKSALMDIKSYLKDPKGFSALGARPPKGVLLSGPPGTGKTRLAKALAGECNVHFIPATGSDFTAMFVGLGAMRVKALFRKARKNAPCIIFIDEMDGIGRRTNTDTGGTSEAEGNRIINQILTELDGFNSSSSGVMVIGATNFPDAVDPALVREGRFDRKIQLALPELTDREALFRLFAKGVKLGGAPDYAQLARLTTGLTPAAIASVVNHAALLSARQGQHDVPMANFLEAIEVCRMGEVNGSTSGMSEAERERVAVHEAGHAIVAQVMNVGRVEKVTILSRGGALGVTLVTQSEDKKLHLKSEIQGRIQMLLAGRAAELITYDDASSGAASDLKEASRLALSMVATLGLSDTGTLFSLDALTALNIKPDTTSAVAQAEIILASQNERCLATLRELRGALLELTAKLVERETIDGESVARAIANARAVGTSVTEARSAAA